MNSRLPKSTIVRHRTIKLSDLLQTSVSHLTLYTICFAIKVFMSKSIYLLSTHSHHKVHHKVYLVWSEFNLQCPGVHINFVPTRSELRTLQTRAAAFVFFPTLLSTVTFKQFSAGLTCVWQCSPVWIPSVTFFHPQLLRQGSCYQATVDSQHIAPCNTALLICWISAAFFGVVSMDRP